MVPSTCPAKPISGGQQEEGHGVVHHRIDKFSAGWTKCRSLMLNVDKDMVVQSHTTPNLICKEYFLK